VILFYFYILYLGFFYTFYHECTEWGGGKHSVFINFFDSSSLDMTLTIYNNFSVLSKSLEIVSTSSEELTQVLIKAL